MSSMDKPNSSTDNGKQGKFGQCLDHGSLLTDSKAAFTPGIVHLLILAIPNALTDYLHQNYVLETFIPLSLNEEEQLAIKRVSRLVALVTFPLLFVPAVLADSYLRKTLLLKMMVTVRIGGPFCILSLSWICTEFSYEDSFDLKYSLYVAFMIFSSINIMTLPIHAAVVLDQIVHARDFIVETARIFTFWLIGQEVMKLVGALIVHFTADDKISAAYAQTVSPVILLPVLIYFLYATRSRNILVSPAVTLHGTFKVLGCTFDCFYRLGAKLLCRDNEPRAFHGVHFSEETKKTCGKFWSLQFALLWLIPYFYFVDGIKFCVDCLEPYEGAVLKVRSSRELYHRIIQTVCLIGVQLIVAPLTYEKKKGFFRLPVRRLYCTYLTVGVLGTIAFCMVVWEQKVESERYSSIAFSSISIHNLMNSPTTAVIEQSKILKPVEISAYGRHLLTFDEPVEYFNIELVNSLHLIEDYLSLPVEGHSTYVLTTFGLEKIEGIEQHDNSRNPTKSIVNIVCLMVVCKGRGYVLIDCGGNFVVRPELVHFGKNIRLEVTKVSRCSAKLLTPKGSFVSGIDFKVDSPEITLAAVDHNQTHPYILVRFEGNESTQLNEWALVPVQVLTEVIHCLFFVALAQFLLLTAPAPLRTTTIATLFFYRFLAHVLISMFVCKNGSFSAVNCYIAIAAFVIAFLGFIYATTKFSLYTLRSDLSPTESLDKARIHPKMSVESVGSNVLNPDSARSIH